MTEAPDNLRDQIAIAAMAGWLASFPPEAAHPGDDETIAANVARASYAIADAMLAQRNPA